MSDDVCQTQIEFRTVSTLSKPAHQMSAGSKVFVYVDSYCNHSVFNGWSYHLHAVAVAT